jgi:serine/threonine protein kinase
MARSTLWDVADVPDGYSIIRLIGSGGSGRVYLAEQRSLERPVALKLFSQDLADDEDSAEFNRECEATRQLGRSDSVVTIYEAGVAGGRPGLKSIERRSWTARGSR